MRRVVIVVDDWPAARDHDGARERLTEGVSRFRRNPGGFPIIADYNDPRPIFR
jgi:hypothetical protein